MRAKLHAECVFSVCLPVCSVRYIAYDDDDDDDDDKK